MISRFLYTTGISLLHFAVYIHSFFSTKSRKNITGRKNWKKELIKLSQMSDSWFWVHVASHGEYEQILPYINKLLQSEPTAHILITFFSPSGIENVKSEGDRLHFSYIPWDYPWNSREFIDILSPRAIFFDKYDFWFNHLHTAQKAEIPAFLLNAYFDKSHWVFKFPKNGFFDISALFKRIYTQDKETSTLLNSYHKDKALFTGDTRLDRVIQVSGKQKSFPLIEKFVGLHEEVIVAGSTWIEDETLLSSFYNTFNKDAPGLLIVPHEVNKKHISKIIKLFEKFSPQLYTTLEEQSLNSRILIIDKVGVLKYLYKYADYGYIGGGFGSGVHSILEAIVYHVPVFYGPKNNRSYHANALKQHDLAYQVHSTTELADSFAEAKARKGEIKAGIVEYITKRRNAVDRIHSDVIKYI